jgi:hypothetical protein
MPALLTSSVTSPQSRTAAATCPALVTSSGIGTHAGQRDLAGIACGCIDLARTAGKSSLGEGKPDAAVGTGDEDDGVGELHGVLSV